MNSLKIANSYGVAEQGIAPAKYATADISFTQPRALTGTILSYSLLLLFFVLLYSQLPTLVPVLATIRLVYIVGAAAILTMFIERMMSQRGWELVWPESHLLLGFLVAVAFSCFGALWPHYAVDSTLDLIKAVALYFVIVVTVSSGRRLQGLLLVMVFGGLFPAIGTLQNYSQGQLVEGRASWVGIFANPNELAYSLVILVPLAAYLAMEVPPWKAAVLWIIIAVYIAAIYVSFSRGGMLGLLAVLALVVLRRSRAFTRTLMLVLLAASLALISYGWSRDVGFTQLGTDSTLQERLATIQGGLAMFADHPISGVGVGNSVIAWPLYAPPGIYYGRWLVIHNTFVQTLSETGILGFLPFTLLLVVALYDAHKMSRHGSQPASGNTGRLATGLEIALWGFVICGLSGGFALSWFPYILIGLTSSLKRITQNERRLP
ncbi:MAG: O-antigen ligase family protein [Acidobacteria bacterium]|nr:O-antigen ligase family protein [Acidobacteriota bacterium]